MAQLLRRFFRHRKIAFGLGISFLIVPCLTVFLGLVRFLFEESGSRLTVTWGPLLIIFIFLLLALLILGSVGISFLREDRRAAPLIPYLQGMDEENYEVIKRMLREGRPAVPLIRSCQEVNEKDYEVIERMLHRGWVAPIIRLYLEGMDKRDYEVIKRILRKGEYKGEVELYPLQGGFSTAMLFEVNCPGQLSTVLKLGPRDKIETEEERYTKFVRNRLVVTPLITTEYDEEQGRGALLYPYAALPDGQSVTFEKLYKEASDTQKVTKIIKTLFDSRLNKWFETASSSDHQYLYRNYNLNEREWDRIKEAIKGLDFDPDAQSFPELNLDYNPLKVAQGLFENRQDREFSTKLAVVHGDLNSRNILIDSNDNVFLIDFAKTGEDHILRDFYRLEVEIKYVLTELSHDGDVQYVVDLDRKLVLDHNGQQFSTLEELLIINPQLVDGLLPKFDRMLRSIKALRQRAARVMGLDIHQPPEEYYIGLLHYTLDVLRYQQCDNLSKRFALQSVVILCQALNSDDNQSRVH